LHGKKGFTYPSQTVFMSEVLIQILDKF
jgi:hypothetical protein